MILEANPPLLIDARITELGDWRGEALARVRTLIKLADPGVGKEWKWGGVLVWEHGEIICTGVTCKAVVALTFAKGAALTGPNSSLEGNTRHTIDIQEDDSIDETAFKARVGAAVALNMPARAPVRPVRPQKTSNSA